MQIHFKVKVLSGGRLACRLTLGIISGLVLSKAAQTPTTEGLDMYNVVGVMVMPALAMIQQTPTIEGLDLSCYYVRRRAETGALRT